MAVLIGGFSMKYVKVSGEKIRQARKSKGLTQGDLGASIGVSASMIGQYETEVRRPSFKTAAAVACVLGIDEKELLVDLEADNFREIQELNTAAMTDIEHTIGERIRTERERRGISQKRLAEIAGIPAITLQQYERGVVKRPRIDRLSMIAQALGLPIDDFLVNDSESGNEAKMSIGEKIGELSLAEGMNLRQLAIKADVPYNTVYALVKRSSNRVEWETLEKIAAALGVSAQALRGYVEMPEVSDVARLSVSVSEIGRLLQSGEITVSTSQQTIHIALSDK